MTASADLLEGVDLRPGALVPWFIVETKSRHYLIECLGGNAMRISGHSSTAGRLSTMLAELQGSIDAGVMVETGFISLRHGVFA